jgi:hypothetical protein
MLLFVYLCIFLGGCIDLFERCTTVESLDDTILFERYHTIGDRDIVDHSCSGSIDDHLLHIRGDLEDLIDTNSTSISDVITLSTADGFVECWLPQDLWGDTREEFFLCSTLESFLDTFLEVWLEILHSNRFLALHTELADQSLCDDRVDRCWEEEGGYTHIQDTSEGLSSGVRMDRRDHEVTREGCFDRDVDRLMITDFSYHDDIRILTQSSTQSRGKRISDIWEHL